ncbi:membrane protein [Actinoplanes sp. OR16]|uniref:TIGR03943 family putative permease subunit n=1 Tax=Actinoplanes sp. OR16 TaxID=946334 RepID=UPI000F6F12A6|nr:TIGR03943 family protein [Actinoplanes sp. OR16]BBH67361.1 membrane protein [Actinoplanes sp. OR16]
MNRQAQAVVLLLFGGAVLKASLTDLHLRYVKEGLRPFLLLTGAILVLTALFTLWYEYRPRRTAAAGDDHDHAHHEPRVGWLLLLPVIGLLLVAPPALGAFTADQSGTLPAAAESDYGPLPEGDPVPVGLLDYASRSIYDDGRSLGGRRVKLTGFLSTGPDGGPMLARIVVSCCAADGRPIKVGLSGGPVIDVPAGQWVEVVGRHSAQRAKDPVNQADISYLEVDEWQPIRAPKQQYE